MNTITINPPQVYQYNGTGITFFKGDNLMINATEMAKAFAKQPSDWTKTKQSQEFIASLSAVRKICGTELIKVVQGGNDAQGTWMHEDVALEFARWLSPVFAIWCNDKVKELMTKGFARLDSIGRKDLAKMLYESEVEKEKLAIQNSIQEKQLKEAAPKIEYHDKVLQSEGLISVTEMANELGFRTARVLNLFLKEKGIIRKVNGTWAMCANYSGLGLSKYKTHPYTDSQGQIKTAHHLYFTEAGRKFLQKYSTKDKSL